MCYEHKNRPFLTFCEGINDYSNGGIFERYGGVWRGVPGSMAFRTFMDDQPDIVAGPQASLSYPMFGGNEAQVGAQLYNVSSSTWDGDFVFNTDFPDSDGTDDNLEMLMKGLGYQMHLIQDMSQPNHVRNNAHLSDGKGWTIGFETWAKINDDKILNIINGAGIPTIAVDVTSEYKADNTLSPMARLFDTRAYLGTSTPTTFLSQGLSEYTNGNFFSQDTVFSAERYADNTTHKYFFPYPRKESTDIQSYIDITANVQYAWTHGVGGGGI